MRLLPGRIAHFLKRDDGPTAVEYAFLLILIIVVCLTAIALFGEKTGNSLQDSGNQIENAITLDFSVRTVESAERDRCLVPLFAPVDRGLTSPLA